MELQTVRIREDGGLQHRHAEAYTLGGPLACPGTLQGIPEACKIPASLLETATIVRDEILDIIGPEPKTIAVMLKDIRGRHKILKQLDEHIDLEVEYLAEYVELKLKQERRADIMAFCQALRGGS